MKVNKCVCDIYHQQNAGSTSPKNQILSNFTALVQSQCSPKLREQMFPYVEAASVIVSSPQDVVHVIGTAAPVMEIWIGLGPWSIIFYVKHKN